MLVSLFSHWVHSAWNPYPLQRCVLRSLFLWLKSVSWMINFFFPILSVTSCFSLPSPPIRRLSKCLYLVKVWLLSITKCHCQIDSNWHCSLMSSSWNLSKHMPVFHPICNWWCWQSGASMEMDICNSHSDSQVKNNQS